MRGTWILVAAMAVAAVVLGAYAFGGLDRGGGMHWEGNGEWVYDEGGGSSMTETRLVAHFMSDIGATIPPNDGRIPAGSTVRLQVLLQTADMDPQAAEAISGGSIHFRLDRLTPENLAGTVASNTFASDYYVTYPNFAVVFQPSTPTGVTSHYEMHIWTDASGLSAYELQDMTLDLWVEG